MLRIEKAMSHPMTLGKRGNIHGFHEFQFNDFRRVTNLKLQLLPYSCRFIYLTFDDTGKQVVI